MSKPKTLRVFIFLALLSFTHATTLASEGASGNTALIGEPGGVDSQVSSCDEFHRITGIQIFYHSVINSVGLKCTKILKSGKWGPVGTSHWISTYSVLPPAPLPRPKIRRKELHCPRDTYIGAVKGKSKQYLTYRALSEITFKCYNANSQGKRIQQGSVVKTLRASVGDKQYNFSYCPGNGFASNIYSRHGWSLDNFKLSCKTGTHSIQIPYPLNPSGHSRYQRRVSSGAVKFKFTRWRNATSYKLCIKDNKNSSCNIHFKNHPTSSSGEVVTIPVSVANKYHNKTLYWAVMACEKGRYSGEICGRWSKDIWFEIKPPAKVFKRKR